MGGLAGLVHFQGPAPARPVLQAMSEALAHRGPDGSGDHFEGPAALAHRMRRVRPDQMVQPLVTDDLVVLLDGWLYDHAALGSELGAQEGASDTEVLAHAWRAWGADALDRLDGEFAFAVWERRTRRITLARDRVGTRPLFWSARAGRLAFASELPALLKVPWIGRQIDRARIAEYLSFQVVHAPRTLLEDVEQVEPGCIVLVAKGFTKTRRYWQPPYAPPGTSAPPDGEVVDQLNEALQRAVRRRVPPGVDTGLLLSGGLGSAAIAMAAATQHIALPAFTVAFADDPFPEAPFAGRVATLLGLELTEVIVGTSELSAMFDDAVAALGQPVGHPAVLLQLPLARAARKRARVVLSGNGGESLFGGRQLEGLARDLAVAAVVNRLPQAVIGPLGPWLRQSAQGRRLATAPDHYALELGLGGADLFSTEEREALLRQPELVRPGVRQEVLGPLYAGLDTDPINLVLHGTLRSVLGERALPRTDRTAAAAGLDIRYPLLDTAVVEAAAALPGSAKVRRVSGVLHTRWPLRALLDNTLPAPILDRPKRSLPTPLGTWLAGPGRLFLESRFQQLKADPLGLWQTGALEGLRHDVARSNAAGNRLWTLFVLDAWLRTL